VELRGLGPLTSSMPWWPGNAGDGLRALIECRVVQALPPPFSPGAPQFAPHASNSDRGDPEPPFLSLGKPVNPLVRWCFQAEKWHLRARLVAFLEGSAREGSSS
jgi:hypothetical protein